MQNPENSFGAFVATLPLLHTFDGGKTWNTGGFERQHFEPLAAFFDRELVHRRHVIETGCGNSTIFFLLMCPDKLVTIDPDEPVYRRVTEYCASNDVRTDRHEMHHSRSELVLPKMAELYQRQFDFALIDGDHSWPTVFVDFCYCNMLIRQGSFIMVDDLHLHSCKELARLLTEEPGYSLALDLGKALVFKKLTDELYPRGWGVQPYIARNTAAYQTWQNPNALYLD